MRLNYCQEVSAKNLKHNLVFFETRSRFFLISLFETRSRFVSSISRVSRRDREFAYNISDFEKGARNKTINSRGRARILDANSRETFRDREFSPMSGGAVKKITL